MFTVTAPVLVILIASASGGSPPADIEARVVIAVCWIAFITSILGTLQLVIRAQRTLTIVLSVDLLRHRLQRP